MKSVICVQTEQPIQLTHRMSVSGEGEIWETHLPGQLAKIYASPNGDRLRKLQVMVDFPPADPNRALNHISFAWPTSILRDYSGTPVGFLMPTITNSLELINVYNPKRRKNTFPGFNWMYLHTAALNVASLIWRLHQMNVVVGDIKPQNILINSEALPSIIDTDSFQIRHPQTGEVFPCPVGSEGFTPRELLGQDLATVHQTDIHDRFRLGVIIYLLLFGEHPFKGQWVGPGDSPEPNELVEKGYWPFAESSLIQPGPSTISLKVVHPAVRESFIRCFSEGHEVPERRPSAQDWVQVLNIAIDDLKGCWVSRNHFFSSEYGRCVWCDRRKKLGVDVFNPKPLPAPKVPSKKVTVQKVPGKKVPVQKVPVSPQPSIRSSRNAPPLQPNLPQKTPTGQPSHRATQPGTS
ncbi:MAG: hypothetical protein VKL39_07600, partial [Leptolyngbyaceae bacterium]|nr:hypothetical protein [Leptolyngbyaceae bacterium]